MKGDLGRVGRTFSAEFSGLDRWMQTGKADPYLTLRSEMESIRTAAPVYTQNLHKVENFQKAEARMVCHYMKKAWLAMA